MVGILDVMCVAVLLGCVMRACVWLRVFDSLGSNHEPLQFDSLTKVERECQHM